MSVKDIVDGHIKMIFNQEDEMSEQRMKICKKCPLCVKDSIRGWVCSKKLYINPETDEVSLSPKQGWIRGCNCTMSSKTRLKHATCIAGKW